MEINEPRKNYYAPMHTAEHILNSCMVRYFHCGRSFSAHIEKKKSKCDYRLEQSPSPEDIQNIENQVNDIIKQNLDIEINQYPLDKIPEEIDLSKLPDPHIDTVRLVKIGTYDLCPCIGEHVSNTSEIGRFKIVSADYEDGKLRIRFKLEDK